MIVTFRELGHKVLPVIMGGTESENIKEDGAENKLKRIAKNIIPKILWETLKDIQLFRFEKYAEKQLEEEVKRFSPDLIYERANYGQVSGVKIAKRYRLKHILEINSPYVEERITLQGKSLFLKKAEQIKQLIKRKNLIL